MANLVDVVSSRSKKMLKGAQKGRRAAENGARVFEIQIDALPLVRVAMHRLLASAYLMHSVAAFAALHALPPACQLSTSNLLPSRAALVAQEPTEPQQDDLFIPIFVAVAFGGYAAIVALDYAVNGFCAPWLNGCVSATSGWG